MGNYSMKYKYEYKVDGSIHHESPFLHRRKKNCLYIWLAVMRRPHTSISYRVVTSLIKNSDFFYS